MLSLELWSWCRGGVEKKRFLQSASTRSGRENKETININNVGIKLKSCRPDWSAGARSIRHAWGFGEAIVGGGGTRNYVKESKYKTIKIWKISKSDIKNYL